MTAVNILCSAVVASFCLCQAMRIIDTEFPGGPVDVMRNTPYADATLAPPTRGAVGRIGSMTPMSRSDYVAKPTHYAQEAKRNQQKIQAVLAVQCNTFGDDSCPSECFWNTHKRMCESVQNIADELLDYHYTPETIQYPVFFKHAPRDKQMDQSRYYEFLKRHWDSIKFVFQDHKGERYANAVKFFTKMKPSRGAVLAGHTETDKPDIYGSIFFLKQLQKMGLMTTQMDISRALEVGAGYGRVTKSVLFDGMGFQTVDMIEPSFRSDAWFQDTRAYLKEYRDAGRVGFMEKRGIEEFIPKDYYSGGYDLIFLQWVQMYIADDTTLDEMRKCKEALGPKGVIVVKENLSGERATRQFDREDSSISRTNSENTKLFNMAGLRVAYQWTQRAGLKDDEGHDVWVDGYLPMEVYALVPDDRPLLPAERAWLGGSRA